MLSENNKKMRAINFELWVIERFKDGGGGGAVEDGYMTQTMGREG